MADEIQAWADGFIAALKVLRHPAAALSPPPARQPGEPVQEYAAALLRVRAALGVSGRDRSPAIEAGRRWANIATSITNKDDIEQRLPLTVDALDAAVTASLVEADPQRLGLVRAADFGADGITPLPIALGDGTQVRLAAGLVKRLPQGHWLRTCLTEDECYQITPHGGSRQPALVLGPMLTRDAARPWYVLSEAKELTANRRAPQKADEDEAAYQYRVRRAQQEQEEKAARDRAMPKAELLRALRELTAEGAMPHQEDDFRRKFERELAKEKAADRPAFLQSAYAARLANPDAASLSQAAVILQLMQAHGVEKPRPPKPADAPEGFEYIWNGVAWQLVNSTIGKRVPAAC